MTPGSHNLTFQYALLSQLPTSFENERGHIRYTACVVLDTPIWADKELSMPFTVNLNDEAALRVIYLIEMCENERIFMS